MQRLSCGKQRKQASRVTNSWWECTEGILHSPGSNIIKGFGGIFSKLP